MMKFAETRNWLLRWALVPVLAGGFAIGCDDDDPPVTPPVDGGTVDAPIAPDAAPPADTGPLPDGAAPADSAPLPDASPTCAPAPAGELITADVATSTLWNCPIYTLQQKVYVMPGAVLTIAPGVRVQGNPAAGDVPALIVTRGAQLIAKGTAQAPIVFTSGNPAGARQGGDWAGVALLGDAPINTGTACAAGPTCKESGIEGIAATEARAKFGGINPASSCGELEYVRIEFAGKELEPNRELNGLTLGGCGSGTKLSHIQVHRGTDDGIEFFGGTANMDHVVLSGNEDDSLDWDFGWTGKVQFLVLHQRSDNGDYGIEGAGSPSGETLAPLTNPTIYNMTALSTSPSGKAIIFKEGSLGRIYNSIIMGFKGDVVDFRSAEINYATLWPAMTTIENTLFWMNGVYVDETMPNAMGMSQDDDMGFPDQASVEDPARMNLTTVDPMIPALASTLVTAGEARPNYIPANAAGVMTGAATPPVDGFFMPAPYKGAFAPGGPDWTAGWTDYPLN